MFIESFTVIKANMVIMKYCLLFFFKSGMCWVKLNVFHLEVSLKGLAQKFGNISSNKDNIGTFVQILQEMRYHIGHGLVSYFNQVIINNSISFRNLVNQ